MDKSQGCPESCEESESNKEEVCSEEKRRRVAGDELAKVVALKDENASTKLSDSKNNSEEERKGELEKDTKDESIKNKQKNGAK